MHGPWRVFAVPIYPGSCTKWDASLLVRASSCVVRKVVFVF